MNIQPSKKFFLVGYSRSHKLYRTLVGSHIKNSFSLADFLPLAIGVWSPSVAVRCTHTLSAWRHCRERANCQVRFPCGQSLELQYNHSELELSRGSDAISKGKYRYLQYRYIREVNIDITDISAKVSDISI